MRAPNYFRQPEMISAASQYFSALIDIVLHIDQHLAALAGEYGVWIYAVLFVIVFCETGLVFTPFLPGDSLGDAVNFAIGKAFGARLFSRPNSRLFKPEYLQKTHAFYEKYGGKTIILARFVPVVRTFAPFVAGMGRMHYATFIRYNIIGALAWVLLLTYLGYAFGNVPLVKQNFGLLVIGIIVVSVLPMAVEIVRAFVRKKRA